MNPFCHCGHPYVAHEEEWDLCDEYRGCCEVLGCNCLRYANENEPLPEPPQPPDEFTVLLTRAMAAEVMGMREDIVRELIDPHSSVFVGGSMIKSPFIFKENKNE